MSKVTRASRYAASVIAADPSLMRCLRPADALDAAAMRARLVELASLVAATGATPAAALASALRRLRREVFLSVMAADLTGRWPLEVVVETLSTLAEVTLQAACDLHWGALVAEHGLPRDDEGRAMAFVVIGMGKLGGRELNASSDVDLVFVHEGDGETDGARVVANADFFARLGKRVIAALDDIDADGYVFRVDMRLRPNGDSGPLVPSLAMLETYFVVQGRDWERYAWLKARPVATASATSADAARLIDDIEALRRPFVFRRYLDYGAIGALRDLHRQIREQATLRATRHPERALDVKLGRGGIREIEFVAQVFQLIHGGRSSALQTRSLQQALARLAAQRLIESDVAARLAVHYRFLRTLEHRLQYLDDRQTHSIPADADDRARIAEAMNLRDADALLAALAAVQSDVANVFDHAFESAPQQDTDTGSDLLSLLADDDGLDEARARLEQWGLVPGDEIARRLATLARSRRIRTLPEASRRRLEALIEPLLGCLRRLPAASRVQATARFADLIEAIAPRSPYLALLCEYPAALERVGRLLTASGWAASWLTRHPILLDELLDRRGADDVIDWTAVRTELDRALDAARLPDGTPDTERRLDELRETHHLWSFRLLVRDLDGQLSVEALGDDLSALADLIVDAALASAWAGLDQRHRDAPRFAVIAYGKLGSKELGYASDLDLVFVHDDDDPAAADAYVRLARRLVIWLTSITAAGRLFEVDLRLRPNGDAGLPVTTFAGFERYQTRHASNSAWVWEHQALTRARFCAGHEATGRRFEALRLAILREPRDRPSLFAEIVAMRTRMRDGHPNATLRTEAPLFDLKHDPGGMVDIEFIVQALVLDASARHPDMAEDVGNIALLHRAADHGLLPREQANGSADAYRAYRARQHALRLESESSAGPSRVDPVEFAAERACVQATWQHLFA